MPVLALEVQRGSMPGQPGAYGMRSLKVRVLARLLAAMQVCQKMTHL
jgi:hypothetical protein